ncbi:uncharacterized protein LOC110982344 [Acanthaster planci]|uniref:Uncharacterized protein LOC110982344 n=1 Tax=Acanthaster planci TaxID=133434 RepID=A0A8B7YYQ1_ACAPL|nr:uncharacterized protein LOC110982344 [Acanthaster planci]
MGRSDVHEQGRRRTLRTRATIKLEEEVHEEKMMEQGVANEWAASVESTEPESGLKRDSSSSHGEDPSDSHSDSDEEQEQWMEKTASRKAVTCQSYLSSVKKSLFAGRFGPGTS